jgi:hypothetical protein
MHLIRSAAPLLPVLALISCDDGGVSRVIGELEAPEVVDFGDVQIGIIQPMTVDVENVGAALVSAQIEQTSFTGENYEFRLSKEGEPVSTLDLQAGQTETLTLTFQAFEAMEEPVEATFRMVWQVTPDEQASRTVTVRARGVETGLEVMPNPIDFGKVLVGSSRTLDVRITNRLGVAVEVFTAVNTDGKAELLNEGGLGRFELLEPSITQNGSLLPEGMLLATDESITVKLRYTPDPSQIDRPDMGRWTLSNCPNPLCEQRVTLMGEGTNAAIECEPSTIDFGQVNPGVTSTQRTVCRNVATEAVTVLGWETAPGTAREYTVLPYAGSPTTLGPNETFEVEAQFSPTVASVGTDPAGSIRIRGRNPVASRDLDDVRVQLTGEAGGPDVSVLPAAINFGRIALGTTGKRRILVENTGYNQLTVSRIDADVNGTGTYSVDRTAFTVDPGAAEVVEVTFRPTAEGAVMSRVLIASDDSDEGEVYVDLSGEGVDLPPCSYTVSPVDVNFGIVQVLRASSQGVRINNVGTNDCLINDIEIALGSSPAFGLANGAETGIILPPGEEKNIVVEYTPMMGGVDEGVLTFYISDPTSSNPEIPLRGVGSESALLITPNEIDFGQVGVGCSTRQREVTVYNTGSANTWVDRIEIPAGVSMEFKIENLPAGVPNPPGAGAQIAPGASIVFSVRYESVDLGVDNGFFHLFERGRTDPYVVPMFGQAAKNPVNTDEFEQLETPEVDILFVIDNSCSMSEEQASLASNFSSFIQFADSQALDYRIATVTTDVDGCPATTAQRPANLDQGQCGYFADGNGDETQQNPSWRLITPDEEPSPEQAFAAVVSQGILGSGTERGLEAAYRALSSPIITGWNNGFLRPNAYLALIFVADEDDHSAPAVDFYIDYFLAIKGFRNTNLFSASAIVGDVPSGCPTAPLPEGPGTRYLATAERTGGIFESICTADWSQSLQNLGLSVFGYKSRFFLTNQPVAGTVEVFVDGTRVDPVGPQGQVRWTYDTATNTVNFAPLAIPEPGSEITITYQPECL